MNEQDIWEARLKEDGLPSIDFKIGDVIYITPETVGRKYVVPLDEDMGDVLSEDTNAFPNTPVNERALALVCALPKPMRVLGKKKVLEGLTRSEGQTLRRLLQYFTWEKLQTKLIEDVK